MFNSFKRIEDFINELPALHHYLTNAGNYHAHTSKAGATDKKPETLEEHINLVNSYFKTLVTEHKIDDVLDNLIGDIAGTSQQQPFIGNFIKSLFADAIVYHDFGKINERFQSERMNNALFASTGQKDSPITSTHSSLSAFIYLAKQLDEIVKNFKSEPILVICCLMLSYSIFKHHNEKFDNEIAHTINFSELQAKHDINELREFLSGYLELYQFNVDPKIIKLIGDKRLLEHLGYSKHINSFSLYALCKLNFSLLTAADYLATNEYMNDLPIADFGTLNKERINKLYQNISHNEWINEGEQKRNYNKLVYDALEGYKPKNPKEIDGINLNLLRQEMCIEVIRNVQQNYEHNLFYIEAPTGGGKTNLSILATIELLKRYEGRLNKVFYVFPFTTLITQTYKSIQETLGLHNDEIVELHSNAVLKEKQRDDARYGSEKLNYINNLFVNYPFCLLSHIRFFDVLKTNEKEGNYLLHRLANSVVVIDELQTYNPAHWDKVIYFVKQYADKFNIKFILMSATLPKLDKLKVIKEQGNAFVYLLPDAKKDYFQNPNFSGRVDFNFDLFDRTDLTLKELADKVLAESERYATIDLGNAKPSNSVYTIVEFIYKQSATEFHEIMEQYNFFDEAFVLSGTILEHRRKEIINYLKNRANRKKKILLITTQVVEAGVDIDMDLGFKDRSLIDSDEQLAGRINRNVNKKHCTLFLFNYNKESVIYGKDNRYEITKNKIKKEEYKRILEEKDFDALYNQVLDHRNGWNEQSMAINFADYETSIKKLKFLSAHEDFKLIDQKNISCFIPLNIPVIISGVIEGETQEIFNNTELIFLSDNNIYPTDRNEISGEQVFDLYLDSIHNRIAFTQQQIRKKLLQSILSKYVFSIFSNDRIEGELVHFSDEEKSDYGYKYLQRWDRIYSIEKGIDSTKLGSVEETQFL